MDASQLARYVNDNWKKITDLPEEMKHEEGEFPDEVLELVKFHGVDYYEFCDAWSSLHG